MDDYEKGSVLGEGTFGSVILAKHKKTGELVAIKKIRVTSAKDGINVTALREIKLLKELASPHIIRLIDVFPHKKNLALVFEYMQSDLEAVIKDKAIILSEGDVKSYMRMILQAMAFCHSHWVLHRDVKPNNMLIASTGELKLADFGLARIFASPDRRYTNQVFARWYRAPELLFGTTTYSPAVDIWAVGCVFAELLLRRPWLPGHTDIDQLGKIFQAVGTPTQDSWPGVKELPNYVEFHKVTPPPLRAQFPKISEDGLDLLTRMVQLDPRRRPTAEEALQHPFFTNGPQPTPPSKLPRPVARRAQPLQMTEDRPTAPQKHMGSEEPAPKRRHLLSASEAAGAGGPLTTSSPPIAVQG